MTLSDQALAYWNVCTKYRGSASMIGRKLCASSEIPAVYLRSTNHRIQSRLAIIMSKEGITHVEAQSPHSGS